MWKRPLICSTGDCCLLALRRERLRVRKVVYLRGYNDVVNFRRTSSAEGACHLQSSIGIGKPACKSNMVEVCGDVRRPTCTFARGCVVYVINGSLYVGAVSFPWPARGMRIQTNCPLRISMPFVRLTWQGAQVQFDGGRGPLSSGHPAKLSFWRIKATTQG